MKKLSLKPIISFLLTLTLLFILAIPCFASDIQILLNGKNLSCSIPPLQENGTTLVPLRVISENLGAQVGYDNALKKITISSPDTLIELHLNSIKAQVNGKSISLTAPPKSINNTTMVPLRFISENLNCSVKWDAANNTIHITSSQETTSSTSEKTLPVATIVVKDYGKMILELYPNFAPNTVNNFIYLANEGFYDGLTFHRIIDHFMIQGGDPTATGAGGPGYSIPGEFLNNGYASNTLSHTKGIISMARSLDPNSAGSQFFITSADASYLDGEYAAFGKVIDGLSILDSLSKVPTNSNDMPLNTVIIESIRVDTKGINYASPLGYFS